MVVARKKPVEVEVYQFDRATFWTEDVRNHKWPVWIKKAIDEIVLYPELLGDRAGKTFIFTLEGEIEVTDGDWIIRGVHGELYPCKPGIFTKTYDLVEECPTCGASPGDECRGCDD